MRLSRAVSHVARTRGARRTDGCTRAKRPAPVYSPDDDRPATPAHPQRLARRVLDVPPSGIRKFFDVIATMPDVISLGVGEPDFDTPPQVVQAGIRALENGRPTTPPTSGLIELRRALADHLDRLYGVRLRPRHGMLVTVGASEAVVALALRRGGRSRRRGAAP